MQVSDDVTLGLSFLGSNMITDDGTTALVQAAFAVLTKKLDESAIYGSAALGEVDPAALKQMYHALTAVILEGAKRNLDADVACAPLEEAGVPEARINAFSTLYGKCLGMLREILFSAGFNYPHVVDAQWRLDYVIKDSNLEKIDEIHYAVALITENGGDFEDELLAGNPATLDGIVKLGSEASSSHVGNGTGRKVEFTCSREQLEDLVITLRDATKQMERIIEDE
ncbi:COMM domain-containing protein 3 [Thecamonas trahens ATCC 50062]|uniref:COMM domain-containing protein 3 n=1 Tax=Thecamonas trahens ATCC 50062 TaxID=461836 RepID=A0A0L0DTA1_THETB|nr:COMM domain-containing protein 3 [Thecamonas trahens ATCC 50062]KNC55271.1 COMM domain-containing protein 3 [Thecamonas trahens ATCC 50062]|eukprot:XP_013753094.1 COMM domain-containing protein 3 [Thecamonas trahens ATCC 50062]